MPSARPLALRAIRAALVRDRLPADGSHVISYGMELLFRRDAFQQARNANPFAGVNGFVAKVLQDANKLTACVNLQGFMGQSRTLAFLKGVDFGFDRIRAQTRGRDDILVIRAR